MKIRNLNGAYQVSCNDNPNDDGHEYELPKQSFFKTQAEMTKAMANPLYKKSEGYRQVVRKMISNSDPVALGLQEARGNDRFEYEQQRTAMAREVFRNPLYKTDARYRAQVAAMCASEEADQFFPELSQAQVERKAAQSKGGSYEVPTKLTGPVNPNAKRDPNGDRK